MNKKHFKVLIVDDHLLFAEGMELILSEIIEQYTFEIIAKVENGKEALAELERTDIDLMILDLNMPIVDGIELLATIKKLTIFPSLKILVVTGYHDDKFTRSALKNGADGILLKTSNLTQLREALHEVIKGELYVGDGLRISPRKDNVTKANLPNKFDLKDMLTKRELEVLVLVSKGCSNRVVAGELFISPETVSVHRKNIIKKLKIKNTAELIKFAVEYNLI